MVIKLLELFVRKNCRRQIKQNLEQEKELKEKEISYLLNRKIIIIHSLVGLIKKRLYKMIQYFPKLYRTFGGNISVKVDLSNYATKAI